MAKLTLIAAAVLVASLPCQRDVRAITTDADAKQDAAISPDGNYVAYRGPSKIGVVAFTGGIPGTLVQGANLGSFLWAPNSTGIYYLDGAAVRFVARTGGNPKNIGTLSGQQHRLWDVSSDDATLFGSRYDSQTGTYYLFTLATSGATAPKDIVSSQFVVDGVKLCPDRSKILYRSYSPQPFQPRELFRANPDGSGPNSMTNGAINGNLEDAVWLDNGLNAGINLQSPTTLLSQLALVENNTQTVKLLTDGSRIRRYSSISGNRKWWVCQAQNSPGGGTVAVMPVFGSGLIFLDAKKSFQFNGYPSISFNGERVAFAGVDTSNPGTSQVFVGSLDREYEVTPRAAIGQNITLTLPLRQSEIGSMYVGGLLTTTPITIPSLVGEFWLDLSLMLPLISGIGNGSTPLTLTAPVPNDPGFQNIDLYFQGIRFLVSSGDFTRFATVRIF